MFSKNQNDYSSNPGDNKVAVHTMQDDLNELKNPKPKEKFIEIGGYEKEKKEETKGTSNQASPFLNNNLENNSNRTIPRPPEAPRPVQPSLNNSVSAPVISNSPKINDEKETFLRELAHKREIERQEKNKSLIPASNPGVKTKSSTILFIIIGIIIVIAFLAGGYFFWVTRINNLDGNGGVENNPDNDSQKETVEIQGNITESKFSVNNPNILSLDAEAGSESIKQKLIKTASDIKAENVTAPLEFIVTDNSNNPVAFVDFALDSGIRLPAEILSYTEKDFSLYFYDNNGVIKMGLVIKLKDPEKVRALFRKEEANLFGDLAPLYLEGASLKVDKTRLIFADSSFGGKAIRYANLDPQMISSVDYSISEGQLFFGTSKDTLRAIINKITAP